MSLPDVSRLSHIRDASLSDWLKQTGIDRACLRAHTLPKDDLRTPLSPTRETLYSDAPQAVAVRLLFCGVAVETEEAAQVLGAALLANLREAGVLVDGETGFVRAPFHLRTADGLYLFSDFLGSHPEAVMGAGETTAVVYRASRPASSVDRVLDLGCGAGTLALLLARSAGYAAGTDINPRAIRLARLNAAVNGIGNVEFRQGDLFQPVKDEQFDLLVSQPPYYPNPEGETSIYLHGGKRGDELAQRVMQGIAAHLTPTGRALIFTSWPDGAPSLCDGHMRVLEFHTNRRELNGARQSLTIVEHAGEGPCWLADFEVSAECWGAMAPSRVQQILDAQQLLQGPDEDLLSADLRLPAGAVFRQEGAHTYLDCPEESLIGTVPLEDEMVSVLRESGESSHPAMLRRAVACGLLSPVGR